MMHKNVLKSQNIEGMVIVYRMCVGHIVKGVPLGFWMTNGWHFFCEIGTMQAFHSFYC